MASVQFVVMNAGIPAEKLPASRRQSVTSAGSPMAPLIRTIIPAGLSGHRQQPPIPVHTIAAVQQLLQRNPMSGQTECAANVSTNASIPEGRLPAQLRRSAQSAPANMAV
ncbi:hypothetical protein [Dialister invisus]|uniref:hypothetical protein n=1 Tax=Dialister invisus TaxID=218538 RepID=UPI003A92ED96